MLICLFHWKKISAPQKIHLSIQGFTCIFTDIFCYWGCEIHWDQGIFIFLILHAWNLPSVCLTSNIVSLAGWYVYDEDIEEVEEVSGVTEVDNDYACQVIMPEPGSLRNNKVKDAFLF